VSIIPEAPEEKGLIHFYRKDGAWQYVKESEYESKKAELPLITFATKQVIDDFANKEWPDLENLAKEMEVAAAHAQTDSDSKQEIPAGEPAYYVSAEFDDCKKTAYHCEKAVSNGLLRVEMNPTIFYRISKPVSAASLAKLPVLKTADFFSLIKEDKDTKC